MAASLTTGNTGHLTAGVSFSSSSFLSQSKRLAASSCNPSGHPISISGASVWSTFPGGSRGASCRATSVEHEGLSAAGTTLYGLLGLEQGVGMSDIKTSYRKLARQYHPDVCVAEEQEACTKMFLQVQDAYEVLSDPVRRAKYDYQLMNPLGPASVGWGSMVRRSKESGGDGAVWSASWREQLARFPMKERSADSWAARMRAKFAEGES